MDRPPLNYDAVGVRYDALDAFKRACQQAAASTVACLASHDLAEPAGIRGESAYLLETPAEFLAHVEEGLGTKNLVADAMASLTGQCFYRSIGIDTVATIVNDLITTGGLPVSVAMHAAVGDSSWFDDSPRAAALADGFADGCLQANAVWGGGETPALKGIVNPRTIVLAGSAVGMVRPKSRRVLGNLQPGDAIILVASSGVQTNGLTLCRALADRLPEGYLTKMSDGRPYGDALLDPSVIYVKFAAALHAAGVQPHYLAHLTGHGWRKLMRPDVPFIYRMTDVGHAPPVFDFISQHGSVSRREMYATFNMGAGFAAYVAAADADATLAVARSAGYIAWQGGTIERQGNRKAVVIEPLDIAFEGDTLSVRA